MPEGDPAILAAEQSREAFAQREEELLERIDQVRKLITLKEPDPERLKASVAEFAAVADDMRKVVTEAGEAITALSDACDGLGREMRHMPRAYRAAADGFRARARDYREKRLADQLRAFAKDYEDIAKSVPKRLEQLRGFQEKLPAMKAKAKEARRFMDDMTLFLKSHPGVGAPDPRERYAGQLELFIHSFSEVVKVIEEFRESFRGQALSKAIQEDHRKEVLARKKLEENARQEEERLCRLAAEAAVAAERAAARPERATGSESPPATPNAVAANESKADTAPVAAPAAGPTEALTGSTVAQALPPTEPVDSVPYVVSSSACSTTVVPTYCVSVRTWPCSSGTTRVVRCRTVSYAPAVYCRYR